MVLDVFDESRIGIWNRNSVLLAVGQFPADLQAYGVERLYLPSLELMVEDVVVEMGRIARRHHQPLDDQKDHDAGDDDEEDRPEIFAHYAFTTTLL